MPNQLVGGLVDAVAGRHRVRQLVQHRPVRALALDVRK
jgi:hypothetical protein